MRKLLLKYKKIPVQVRASFWFLMCSFLQKGISLITTPVFTRILTTTEYGQYSVFNSWVQILTPIISLNLYSGVYSQGVVKFENDRNKYSSSLQGLSLTLISLWLVIYVAFHGFWNNLFSFTTVQGLAMFAMIWATGSFNFWSMNQRVDFKYQKLVILTIVVSIIQPIIGIILVTCSTDKVTARIVGIAVVQLLFYTGTFISQMVKGHKFLDKRYWGYALSFNIPLLPHYLSLTVLSSSDRIMIGSMCGDDKAGIYTLAYSLSQVMVMFNTALLQTIEPWIYRKLRDKKVTDIASVAYPSFIIIAAVNLILIMFAPEAIAIFAPEEYHEAIWIVPSVALSVVFMFMYTFFATFEFYYEKTKHVAVATIGGAILNIILNFIFIRIFGYVAAGYTTLMSYILFAILHYCFMCKVCKEKMEGIHPYKLRYILVISGGSMLLGFVFLLSYNAPLVRYGLIGVSVLLMVCFFKPIIAIVQKLLNLKKQEG